MGVFFDIGASYLNLDLAFIAESVVRQGISAFMDIPAKWECVQTYTMPADPNDADYYKGGLCAGEVIKMLFDLNINN